LIKTARKIIKFTWLALAALSFIVFLYLLVSEGFFTGKAYMYLILSAIAAIVFVVKNYRKQ
jgi:hypothetical protein